jgi:uncharacterized protein DUF3455
MTYPRKALDLLRLLAVASSLTPFTAPLPAQSTAVPPVLEVPPGNEEYLRAAASGTQNYICMPSGWTFIGPQATLIVKIANMRQQVATHFLSPNPDEAGTARATWQSSLDTSSVWAKAVASSSDFAGAGAIPWLLLQVVGAEKGPGGGSGISETTYIQRVNTTGGVAPTTSCSVEMRAFVPYSADYVLYRKAAK